MSRYIWQRAWLIFMNSVCIKEFSWVARWFVGVGYLPGRTWKAFHTVSTGLLLSSKLANMGRLSLNNVGIQNCWRLFAFRLFNSSWNYPSCLQKKGTCIVALLLSLFKVLGNPKTRWNNPLGQKLFYMGFPKWTFRGSWTPARYTWLWCIIMCIYTVSYLGRMGGWYVFIRFFKGICETNRFTNRLTVYKLSDLGSKLSSCNNVIGEAERGQWQGACSFPTRFLKARPSR